jgi:prolipoprotein diacylglyceryltransferase
MNLIEEAVIIEVFGIRMYAFGLYVSIGAMFAVAVSGLAGKFLSLKKGTAPLTACLSVLLGMLVSRISFCILNQELGSMTPLYYWPHVNGGGLSLFGMIAGIYLAGWISAKIMKESTGAVMDALSLAVLPLIAAERIGESRIEDFDISRPLDSTFLAESFLATGGDEPCLATYYVAAIVASVLFIVLTFFLCRKEREGSLTIRFLLLFGAASIITESLRYDRFLSVSFVGLQQIGAAIMLAIGICLAIRYTNRPKSVLPAAALISLPVMVAAVIGLEFALDRTTWNKILIYAMMILTVSIPAALGMKLLKSKR